jgi:AcrR family transcriptional regulator
MTDERRPSLRAEQVRQTRAALVDAGRRCFGERGFAATSVEDLAREARVTTGALYHHFPTKAALFETVLEGLHQELLARSAAAAEGAPDTLEALARGFDAYLDAVLDHDVRQILITDAPAVLGLARYTELDEQFAFGPVAAALRGASGAGTVRADEPETLARLLLGAHVRAGMLIASTDDPSATRDAVATTLRGLLTGWASSADPGATGTGAAGGARAVVSAVADDPASASGPSGDARSRRRR